MFVVNKGLNAMQEPSTCVRGESPTTNAGTSKTHAPDGRSHTDRGEHKHIANSKQESKEFFFSKEGWRSITDTGRHASVSRSARVGAQRPARRGVRYTL